jgi:hypothetical protein
LKVAWIRPPWRSNSEWKLQGLFSSAWAAEEKGAKAATRMQRLFVKFMGCSYDTKK